ncbi:DUF1295 domain-containing protein [Cryobacterium algoricola]|uniref:DUF1295 domain-containing protein n=1 Tax=Cryobacterium algoricola TaxID=1259183 RepID=A0ABY2IGL3_9MICO|nr:DUF1295 domain-containing protein [Cryobacterium algoricola]TFB88113.1 DUF1295 domain-containing protein [Cryobacterium algoricola]
MDPFVVCLWIMLTSCATAWILSLLTGEYSWVDRSWSLVPPVYAWVFAAGSGFDDARLVTIAVLVTLWGARLTFNFARKGGYAPGGEDYRWAVLRGRMSPAGFGLFNLFFITIYQNAILLLIVLPAATAALHAANPFGPADLGLTLAFLLLLVGEGVADQQQWDFHRARGPRGADTGGSPAESGAARPDVLRTGLFRYSRHPNYFCELGQWWVVFLFGAVAAGSLLQWSVLGAVLLTGLFIGSTVFTERISVSRHPGYPAYQRVTSAIVPWFPRAVPRPESVPVRRAL